LVEETLKVEGAESLRLTASEQKATLTDLRVQIGFIRNDGNLYGMAFGVSVDNLDRTRAKRDIEKFGLFDLPSNQRFKAQHPTLDWKR
jgi:hypothetical protein